MILLVLAWFSTHIMTVCLVEDVRLRWRTLKDRYVREIRKKKQPSAYLPTVLDFPGLSRIFFNVPVSEFSSYCLGKLALVYDSAHFYQCALIQNHDMAECNSSVGPVAKRLKRPSKWQPEWTRYNMSTSKKVLLTSTAKSVPLTSPLLVEVSMK